MGDAGRAGPGAAEPRRPAAAGRAHQLPGPAGSRVAGGIPGARRRRFHGGRPRPRVPGPLLSERAGDPRRPAALLRRRLLRLRTGPRRADPYRRQGVRATEGGDRTDRGIHPPLSRHRLQGAPGAEQGPLPGEAATPGAAGAGTDHHAVAARAAAQRQGAADLHRAGQALRRPAGIRRRRPGGGTQRTAGGGRQERRGKVHADAGAGRRGGAECRIDQALRGPAAGLLRAGSGTKARSGAHGAGDRAGRRGRRPAAEGPRSAGRLPVRGGRRRQAGGRAVGRRAGARGAGAAAAAADQPAAAGRADQPP